ncbi:MAG: hypothetical protein KCHDKBKB_02255 [Elusimicrobia bacterium]|nr:hypothetical protein [Elusimicrobiota bacterium]
MPILTQIPGNEIANNLEGYELFQSVLWNLRLKNMSPSLNAY